MGKNQKQLFKVSFSFSSESKVRAKDILEELEELEKGLDDRDQYKVRKNF